MSPSHSASEAALLTAAAAGKPDRHGRRRVLVGRGQGGTARALEERGLGTVQPDKHATVFLISDAGLALVGTFEADDHERRIVCDGCGEVLHTETIGGPDDRHPELGDADRLVEPEECGRCGGEMDD